MHRFNFICRLELYNQFVLDQNVETISIGNFEFLVSDRDGNLFFD